MRLSFVVAASALGGFVFYRILRRQLAQERTKENIKETAFNPALSMDKAEQIIKDIPTAVGADRF